MARTLAAAGLGALTGALVGLSAAGVVASVVSALLAMAAGLVALTGSVNPAAAGGPREPGQDRAVAVFAAVALVGLGAGLWVRTHGLLSPSPAETAALWREAGLDEAAAARVAAFTLAGVALSPEGGLEAGEAARPVAASVFFSGEETGDCARVDPARNADPAEVRRSWALAAAPWPRLAETLAAADHATLGAVWSGLCEGAEAAR
jgi:hypothetical protein